MERRESLARSRAAKQLRKAIDELVCYSSVDRRTIIALASVNAPLDVRSLLNTLALAIHT